MTQMKKILLLLTAIILLSSVNSSAEPKTDVKLINQLKYNKLMFEAMPGKKIIEVPFGIRNEQVAGDEQDLERLTPGVPFAFRAIDSDAVWILDSVNKALKLFKTPGKLESVIDLSQFGTIVRDFAISKTGDIWLLNTIEGFIYQINSKGELLAKIEGFQDASSIEISSDGNLLVRMPLKTEILKFNSNNCLEKRYESEGTLSLFENEKDQILGIKMAPKKIELYVRKFGEGFEDSILASFDLPAKMSKATFAGAEIIGRDNQENIYLNLIACDNDGVIYMDRLYKCSKSGKTLAQKDILVIPSLAPDLPREKIVTPEGCILTFYDDKPNYCLVKYQF